MDSVMTGGAHRVAAQPRHEILWPRVKIDLRAPKDRFGRTIVPERDADAILIGAEYRPPAGRRRDRKMLVASDALLIGDREMIVAPASDDHFAAEPTPTIPRRPAVHPDPEPRRDLGDVLDVLWDVRKDALQRPLTVLALLGALYFIVRLLAGFIAPGMPAQ